MRILSQMAGAIALALGGVTLADDKRPDATPIPDTEFVIKAASGGVFEVESSKLAKEMAKSDDVKKFAEKMIADHGKANKELINVAKKANLGIPVNMLDEHVNLLNMVKGAKETDFDTAYLKTQVVAHKEAVALFANAAKNAKDPGLKAFAEKTLPIIKEHYDHVKKMTAQGK